MQDFYLQWSSFTVLRDLDTPSTTGCTHVDFGRLGESSYRMDVVVQDDDPDHHPEAERHRVLTGEPAAVLPERTPSGD